jgi:hypothetical protein
MGTILTGVSLLMIAFSRERDEDEYVAAIRGKYLMLAFYVDTLFLIVALLASTPFYWGYMSVAAGQMFLILFLHVVMFNIAMVVIRRRRSREE